MPIADQDARDRLTRVAAQTGLTVPEDIELLESWSNDVWRCGDVFVRVCFRGDRGRLLREAALGAALPADLLYPEIVEWGRDDDLSWMFVRRVEGEVLWERWKSTAERELRPLIAQLADVLRALHTWTPPADVRAMLEAHAAAMARDVDGVVGHDLLPLPCRRYAPLIDAALTMPFVDPGLVRAVGRRIDELAAHDLFATPGSSVVHGDASFANVLAVEGRVTALIDYEWARLGPPDAELVSLVRQGGHWRAEPPGYPPIMRWLQEDYPEMFAAPDLRERVWLTELAYILRQLVVWPPDGPPETQEETHPVHTLPRLVEAPWAY